MKKIISHIEQLHVIDNERKGWLVLSAFIAAAIIGIIFGWNIVLQSHLVWLVVCVGLVLSVTWWYWTMKLIRQMIEFKREESEVLLELINDIRYIKKSVTDDLTNK